MRTASKPRTAVIWSLGCLLLLTNQTNGQIHSTTSDDGLTIEVLHPVGCTRRSRNGDFIHVHYNGTLEDGTMFDSSYKRFSPFSFQLGAKRVIAGWDEGLLDMCVGEERRLTIPPSLAYGDRPIGAIPAGSTLIFGTKLMGIDGVPDQDPLQPTASSTTSMVLTTTKSTSSAISNRPTSVIASTTTVSATPPATTSPPNDEKPGNHEPDAENGECRLLGPFSLLVQTSLGLVAVLSLVFKRYRERPRRPVKIWFFDVSKQVFGSAMLHVLNLLFSMFSSGNFELANQAQQLTAQFQDQISGQVQDSAGHKPNPCSFYLINLAIDTTIGVPVLFVILRVLHHAAAHTPLARPPESIRSGHYGQPPKAKWWLKQSLIYFIGLVLMKLFVLFLFTILPWIAWVGDWALRWTEGSEALQLAFVMFVFPVIMNALQYYIIDGFIKDPSGGQHQPIPSSDQSSDDLDHSDDSYVENASDLGSADEAGGKVATGVATKEVGVMRRGEENDENAHADSSGHSSHDGRDVAARIGKRNE